MKKNLLILVIFITHFSFGAVDSLIMNNASWKYLDINTRQTDWEKTNSIFNDASWAKGNAQLGYGESDEQKVVSFGANANDKYVTTYFRKSFNVNNPALYGSLTLNLIRDDGAVVYLNGVEIIRSNMPTGTILHSTGASVGIGVNENDWIPYTIPTTNLVAGNNVIAVEIHQFVETTGPSIGKVISSDVSFNLTLAANVSTATGGDTLVNNNSYWRYLDNGSNQGTAWYTNAFTGANTWAAGNAELGYGEGDEATVVSFGPSASDKYMTTYFRRVFNVTAGASYASLDLSIICDDGAVVYLNGTEIYRNNMPTGSINHLTSANTGTTNENNWNTVTLCNGVLLSGQNVIAVEVHQFRDPTTNTVISGDVSFNLRLKGNTSGNCPVLLTRKPYLQMAGTNSVVVRWQTSVPTNGKVFYGAGLTNVATDPNISTEHEVSISGLTANTSYNYQIGYQVGVTNTTFPTDAQTFFKTALPAGTTTDFTAWVIGDFGTGDAGQLGVRDSYLNYANNPTSLAKKADIWLWLGDNAYNDGTPNEYTTSVFSIYPEIMKNTPLFPAVGNHDYANFGDSPGGPHPLPYHDNHEYFKVFSMPTTAQLGGVASNTKRYYSYNYGNVHFIVLDSYGVVTDNTTNPMYVWLQADLMANTKKWIVCYFHHAPYSMGTHNSDLQFSMKNIRQYFLPLLESYQVDLVLSGHSHVYERSYLIEGHYGIESTLTSAMKINSTLGNVVPYYTKSRVNGHGTVYAVCGNSGKGGVVSGVPITTGTNGFPHDAMAVSDKDHYGSMILTFRNNEIEGKYLQSDGTIADNFKIVKNSCVAGVTVEESIMSGNWHTTSTWGCGTVPTTNSLVTIKNGHTVTINSANTDWVKSVNILGILNILPPWLLRVQP
jgi:hypothetical protein